VAFHLTDALPGTACSGTTYSIARGTRLYLTTISVTADTDNSGLVTSHLFAPGLATLQVPLQLALSGGGTWEWTGLQTVNIVLPGPTTVSFCTTSFVAGKDTGDAWVHGYLLS